MNRVRIHWNLQRGGYSVTVKGRVVATPDAACMRDVRFIVSDASLARMRGLGRRKVVAWAEGVLCDSCPSDVAADAPEVTFNPWRGDRFHLRGTTTTVEHAPHVRFDSVPAPAGSKLKSMPRTRLV